MAVSADFDWSLLEGIDWSKIDTPEAWEGVVRERFPAFAWALDDKELGPIIKEAVSGDYTELTFTAKIKATDWWTTRSEAQREWDLFAKDTTNATERQRRITEQSGALSDLAAQLGVEIPAGNFSDLATQVLRNGLNEDEVAGLLLSNSTSFNPGVFTATESAIKEAAASYMVAIDDETARSMAKRSITGELNEAGVSEYMKGIAKQQYPSLSDLIDQGVTVSEYFAPHRQRIAAALGRAPDQVDLTSKEFSDVVSIGDGGQVRPMTLSETDRYIRSKDEYWQNPGGDGEQELYGMVTALAGALGRRG